MREKGNKTDTKFCGFSNWKTGGDCRRTWFGERRQSEAQCWTFTFELPTRHPDGICFGICGLEFRGERRLIFFIRFFITFIINNMKKDEMFLMIKS